jgi:predicted AAA+ superfamily ATPase
LFLKNIFDQYKEKLQVIVSGSSTLEISKNTEFLTGRVVNFYIDRVGFSDFFSYNQDKKNFNFDLNNLEEIKDFYHVFKSKLERDFMLYLTY